MALAALKLFYDADNLPVPLPIAAPPGGGSGRFRENLLAKESAIKSDSAALAAMAIDLQQQMVDRFLAVYNVADDVERELANLRSWVADADRILAIRRESRAAIFREITKLPPDVARRPAEDIEFFREVTARIVRYIDEFIEETEKLRRSMLEAIEEGSGDPRAVRIGVSGFKLGTVAMLVCGAALLFGQREVATIAAAVAGVAGVFIFVGVIGDQHARQT